MGRGTSERQTVWARVPAAACPRRPPACSASVAPPCPAEVGRMLSTGVPGQLGGPVWSVIHWLGSSHMKGMTPVECGSVFRESVPVVRCCLLGALFAASHSDAPVALQRPLYEIPSTFDCAWRGLCWSLSSPRPGHELCDQMEIP